MGFNKRVDLFNIKCIENNLIGDSVYEIFYIEDLNIYIKREGSYTSYNGEEWYSTWYLVKPKKVKITQYIHINETSNNR